MRAKLGQAWLCGLWPWLLSPGASQPMRGGEQLLSLKWLAREYINVAHHNFYRVPEGGVPFPQDCLGDNLLSGDMG